jgi:hypothetical protein
MKLVAAGYGFNGFFAPVDGLDANGDPVLNVVKAIPLKWHLTDATGAPVTTLTDAEISVAAASCAPDTTLDQSSRPPPPAPCCRTSATATTSSTGSPPPATPAPASKSGSTSARAGNSPLDIYSLGDGGRYHTTDFKFTK